MAYEFYLDGYRLPIPPEKFKTKINNNNKTIDLVNGCEYNFLKQPGLTEYEFTFIIPQTEYPFSASSMTAQLWLSMLETKKMDCKPFAFKIIRQRPNGEALFNTGDEIDSRVSLEDYSIEEDAKNLFDLEITVKLKKFRERKTKTATFTEVDGETVAEVKETRQSDKTAPSSYTVKEGDTLWAICKAQLGDGGKFSEVAKLNGISNPNLIHAGQVIKLGS
ncbi:MAG: LysM domain-containing protein [Candidatus Metalachnospira sp.]|nr:LysM domain-containing protein [Candidatus Metalachnospira sp.]